MPAKKVKTKTAAKTKATGKTGFRLSPEQRQQIIDAPDTMTLGEIAEKFSTSVNTVAKYRSGAAKVTKGKGATDTTPTTSPKRGRPALTTASTTPGSSSKGLSLEVFGDQIVIRGSKKNPLVQGFVKEILA